MQNVYDTATGNVGAPVPSCEIKLVDFEKYKSSNELPQGEIWIRGPILSSGYYKDEEKTKEDFDENGYFHTGVRKIFFGGKIDWVGYWTVGKKWNVDYH